MRLFALLALAAIAPAQSIQISMPTANTVSVGIQGQFVGPFQWFPGPLPWSIQQGVPGMRARQSYSNVSGPGGIVTVLEEATPSGTCGYHLDHLVQARGLIWIAAGGGTAVHPLVFRIDFGNDGTDEVVGALGFRYMYFGTTTPIRVRSDDSFTGSAALGSVTGSFQIGVPCDDCPLVYGIVQQGCVPLPVQAGGGFSSPWLQVNLPSPGILVIGWTMLPVPYPVNACSLLVTPDITAWWSSGPPITLAPGFRVDFVMQAALFPGFDLTDVVGVDFRQ